MENLRSYLPELIKSLQQIDPLQIILFGSLAAGNEDIDSDIDLVVILNRNDLPRNVDEKLRNKMFVRNAIREISFEIPIDILVFTKAEFLKMELIRSPFYNEIRDKGEIIYEKAG
ncbi:MAG: nucleotidyltransferase domain-containing protein [Spirochaetales bacterium]|nr:nucleotidyltransferase domain-containing protein [Spirochaetales bacterium]